MYTTCVQNRGIFFDIYQKKESRRQQQQQQQESQRQGASAIASAICHLPAVVMHPQHQVDMDEHDLDTFANKIHKARSLVFTNPFFFLPLLIDICKGTCDPFWSTTISSVHT